MDDVKHLKAMLNELDDQLISCMRCGMCQSVCPVFGETMLEGDVTRGKIALLDSLSKEMISDAGGVKERLEKCLMCGSCESNCPSGVRVTDIFIRARSVLTGYMGLSPVKKAIFRGMLARPVLFSFLVSIGSRFQGLVTEPANRFHDTACSSIISKYLGNRHIIPLAKKPFHKEVRSLNTQAGKSGVKAAFFPGCVVDKIYPEIGKATITVLEHHGVGIFMPQNQGCCGIPALASGDTRTFETLLKHNISLFDNEAFDVLVTPCATCTSTLKKLWPEHAGNLTENEHRKLLELSEKTMDINAFLVDRLNVTLTDESNPSQEKTVTWHDPCHLKKSLGVWEQPRALLTNASGYTFVEMDDADYCCGNGGSFNIQHYDTSRSIGQRKQDNVAASGADIVATGCPACMLQLTDMLSQNDINVSVKHAIELYAEVISKRQ